MLAVSNLTKRFPGADAPILKNISFIINPGERVGLIGPNGCGKSTLLKMIVGLLPIDGGSIIRTPPDLRIGYLAPGQDVDGLTPIGDVLLPSGAVLRLAEADVERLERELAEADDQAMSGLLEALGRALARLEDLSQSVNFAAQEDTLAALSLGGISLETPVSALSGGQKTRLGLAALLINRPQLLVLDEPTNHLDVTALEWLEGWLSDFQGGALIVSHDRTFLDNIVNRIVSIDDRTGMARVHEGNYSKYVITVRSELDKQWAQWRDQQLETARLNADASRTMSWARIAENKGKDRLAKKIATRAKAKEKRLERYLDSEDRIKKPAQRWNLKLDFGNLPTTGQDVVFLEDLSIGYDSAMPLLSGLNLAVRAGERIAVLGPNGHGKSTLLKTIIGELKPLAGRVRLGASVRLGYMAQEQEILDSEGNALATLQEAVPSFGHTEARSFLHFFLFSGDDVFRPTRDLSFGERARLMLAILVARGANLLILDEPINHLDVPSREKFEAALQAFRGSVLAVVHDRYFVDRFATTAWHIRAGKLTEAILEPMLA